jgi:hypothetical protein
MERSRFSTIGTLFTATLLAGAVLLGGCSDSLTGTTPPDTEQQVTVDPGHNTQDDGGADTTPVAGHNTSDED